MSIDHTESIENTENTENTENAENTESTKGKVWLVGAGPGDIGLLTLRARQVLEQADVVIYDALVGQSILALIPEQAERIDAGKRAGNHRIPQHEMNRIILRAALEGHKVVRLKGGDPFLFGRGGEELELLAQNGIPFEVVPGVTSAIAVPAYNGIPVTHRDFTQSVHIITGHRREGFAYDIDFKALVNTGGTLVFLMGLSSLPDIVSGLMEAGMSPETAAAVLQQGTTAAQKRAVAPLRELEAEVRRKKIHTPAIIVVGQVCSLADQFHWYEDRPLAGKKIIVTRPKELVSRMASLLREQGAEVLELPAIRTEAVSPNPALEEALTGGIEQAWDWLVFTSPTGVRIFFEELQRSGRDVRIFGSTKIAAIGKGTEKALRERCLGADLLPDIADGEHLGRCLAERIAREHAADRRSENAGNCVRRILIPRARIGGQELIRELENVRQLCPDIRLEIADIPTYDTAYVRSEIIQEKELIESGQIDYAVFTSASTVRGFAAAVEGADLTNVLAVCIGRQTQEAAAGFGMRTVTAVEATMESVVDKVIETARNRV